jgi:MFS family permease
MTASLRHSLLPWLVVGSAFLALAISFSARASISLVMPVWDAELGWSRGFVSGIVAATLVVMAILAPIAGRMVDRHGVRPLLAGGLALGGLGSLIIAFSDNRFVFAIAFIGICGPGFSVVATHVVSTAIARLFEKRRGLALGIATSGSTGGQFLIMPLVALILAQMDWRWSFIGLGALSLILAPLLWAMLKPQRSDDAQQARVPQASFATDFGGIVRRPAFHILFWSFFLCGVTTTGIIETHLMPYAQFCGFGPVPSAAAYGLLSAVNMVGMIGAGWLTDRINRVFLLGSIYVLRGFTYILLLHIGGDIENLLLFAALFGAVDYATVPPTASLVASHLGLRVMGLAMGLISAGHALGGALGAYAGGFIFDRFQGFDWIWLSAIGLAILAGLMVFVLKDRAKGAELAAA